MYQIVGHGSIDVALGARLRFAPGRFLGLAISTSMADSVTERCTKNRGASPRHAPTDGKLMDEIVCGWDRPASAIGSGSD